MQNKECHENSPCDIRNAHVRQNLYKEVGIIHPRDRDFPFFKIIRFLMPFLISFFSEKPIPYSILPVSLHYHLCITYYNNVDIYSAHFV